MTLVPAAQLGLLAAGVILLAALGLGVWKYRQILASPDGQAHIYVDIAHRAALMYSFAAALLAVFAQFSAWPGWVNVAAVAVVLVFFVGAIASYAWHGARRDTTNQFHPASGYLRLNMVALIAGEIGGTAVLVAGFVAGQWF